MKKLMLLVIISILTIVLAACGGSDSTTSGSTDVEAESFASKLTVGTTQTEDSHYGAFLKTFKEKIEADSNGEISVSIHYNSEIGNERDMLESVQLGTLDGTFISTGVISNFVKDFNVLDFPFLFDNVEHARTTLSGEVGDILNSKLEENGIVNLAFAENGFRHITNSKQPIEKPEDLEKLKIRTMEVPIHQEVFSAFGASPTPMAWSEVFTSLQQGVIDAQENPIAIIYSSKFEEVQKYISLTGHVYSPAVLLVGKATFEKFSEEHQEIIRKASEEAKQANFTFIDDNEANQMEELKSKGMEINEVDTAAFQAAAQPTIDKYKGEYAEIYNKIKENAN